MEFYPPYIFWKWFYFKLLNIPGGERGSAGNIFHTDVSFISFLQGYIFWSEWKFVFLNLGAFEHFFMKYCGIEENYLKLKYIPLYSGSSHNCDVPAVHCI